LANKDSSEGIAAGFIIDENKEIYLFSVFLIYENNEFSGSFFMSVFLID